MKFSILLIATLLFSACSTAPKRSLAFVSDSTLLSTLPKLTTDDGELLFALKKALKNRTKGKTDAELTAASEKIRDYLFFLGLSSKDLKKAEATVLVDDEISPAKALIKKIIKKAAKVADTGDDGETGGEVEDKIPSNLRAIMRLFISSTQFLDCASMVDWECLEKPPVLKPTASFRTEQKDFSTAVAAGKSLDMDVYFTEGWDGSERSKVADNFAEKINLDAGKTLSLAMYGIDDIKGSMSGVYQAIMEKARSKQTTVKAVVDVMGVERGGGPWVFNYLTPDTSDKNIFSISKNLETPEGMHLTFQYNGTSTFIREMNEGITTQEGARVRIEWPFSRIMHNKFAVLENNKGEKSVWTGTANISKNCMGVEANANMSVYIRNNAIAEAFQDEFNLMYNFDKSIVVKSKIVTSESEMEPIIVGRFHRAKFPVSKRFFTFEDGTNLRVHFAPTDDAGNYSGPS